MSSPIASIQCLGLVASTNSASARDALAAGRNRFSSGAPSGFGIAHGDAQRCFEAFDDVRELVPSRKEKGRSRLIALSGLQEGATWTCKVGDKVGDKMGDIFQILRSYFLFFCHFGCH